jgi:hypothetical protein
VLGMIYSVNDRGAPDYRMGARAADRRPVANRLHARYCRPDSQVEHARRTSPLSAILSMTRLVRRPITPTRAVRASANSRVSVHSGRARQGRAQFWYRIERKSGAERMTRGRERGERRNTKRRSVEHGRLEAAGIVSTVRRARARRASVRVVRWHRREAPRDRSALRASDSYRMRRPVTRCQRATDGARSRRSVLGDAD